MVLYIQRTTHFHINIILSSKPKSKLSRNLIVGTIDSNSLILIHTLKKMAPKRKLQVNEKSKKKVKRQTETNSVTDSSSNASTESSKKQTQTDEPNVNNSIISINELNVSSKFWKIEARIIAIIPIKNWKKMM